MSGRIDCVAQFSNGRHGAALDLSGAGQRV